MTTGMILFGLICYVYSVGGVIYYMSLCGAGKIDIIVLLIMTVIIIIYILGVIHFGTGYNE